MNTIFLTGGSGFIGGWVIKDLVSAGYTVRALARSATAAEAVRRLGAEPVLAELTDKPRLKEALHGCAAVVHAAASTALWDLTGAAYTVNVTGTETLLAAAREAGVRRFIHISTEAVLLDARGEPLVQVNEQHPYPQRPTGIYPQTKGLAEQRVRAANGPSFTTVILRPRLVWGPDDTSLLAGIVDAVNAGQWVWIGGGRHLTSTTHVVNVAEGVRLALERGQGGQVYFLSDGPSTEFRSFVTDLLATQGINPGKRVIGKRMAWTLAGALEGIWRVLRLRGAPPLHRTIVQLLGGEVTVDDNLARQELGYVGVMSRERGLREMAGLQVPAAAA